MQAGRLVGWLGCRMQQDARDGGWRMGMLVRREVRLSLFLWRTAGYQVRRQEGGKQGGIEP